MSVLNRQCVESIGFASLGENVVISDRASFYNCGKISIGNNVRIDDFSVISAGVGGISIGNNVHIAVFSSLIGAGKITLSDFSNISSRVSIYSSSDDYSGEWMTNPTVPSEFTGVIHADVFIGRHAIIGAGSVVLPGVIVEEGVAIGALSLVKKHCKAFSIYTGIPAKMISSRKRDFLDLEKRFLSKSVQQR
ncbi:acyltransferase [Desulfosediminicola ganghwensis]|uniref:acyltransferase n=1 Tax=Desulfosediminicola ganghwensis TaxID=2569540 RepID=UPI0010ACE359|nr:acyltransferase [Desulfosediminicola ganghwensis]